MMPATEKRGTARAAEAEWRADPLPPPPGEDGSRPTWAWVGSAWFIAGGLVVAGALMWARAQGWL